MTILPRQRESLNRRSARQKRGSTTSRRARKASCSGRSKDRSKNSTNTSTRTKTPSTRSWATSRSRSARRLTGGSRELAHRLGDGRARGKESRDEVAHLVTEFADFSQKLSDNLPMLEALLWAAGGAAVGSRFGGPLGALLGGLIGGFMPGAVKAENDPSGHSADTGIRGWWQRHAPGWLGGSSANYQDVPNAGNLTKLITEVSKEAGIDPRIMEGIRAGESGHGGRYDVNNNPSTGDLSYGPFQLNKLHPGDLGSIFERETADERKRLGFGGFEDPRTIPMQARFVAQYIKRTGSVSPWAGFHGLREADPRWGDAGYVPGPAGSPTASRRLVM